jgi:hypothetical protein
MKHEPCPMVRVKWTIGTLPPFAAGRVAPPRKSETGKTTGSEP